MIANGAWYNINFIGLQLYRNEIITNSDCRICTLYSAVMIVGFSYKSSPPARIPAAPAGIRCRIESGMTRWSTHQHIASAPGVVLLVTPLLIFNQEPRPHPPPSKNRLKGEAQFTARDTLVEREKRWVLLAWHFI